MAGFLCADFFVGGHDKLHVLLADAAARILDLDPQHSRGAVRRTERGADIYASGLRELYCVADEIEQELSYALGVHQERGKALRMRPDLERRVCVRGPERLDDVPYQLRGRGVDRYDFKAPGLELREVEDMFDEPQERLAADEDGIDRLLALRIGLEAHLHHLGIPDDRV